MAGKTNSVDDRQRLAQGDLSLRSIGPPGSRSPKTFDGQEKSTLRLFFEALPGGLGQGAGPRKPVGIEISGLLPWPVSGVQEDWCRRQSSDQEDLGEVPHRFAPVRFGEDTVPTVSADPQHPRGR
jgi:hypothetical protein